MFWVRNLHPERAIYGNVDINHALEALTSLEESTARRLLKRRIVLSPEGGVRTALSAGDTREISELKMELQFRRRRLRLNDGVGARSVRSRMKRRPAFLPAEFIGHHTTAFKWSGGKPCLSEWPYLQESRADPMQIMKPEACLSLPPSSELRQRDGL